MPRGSKPGEGNRGGGRKKGTVNKATIEKAIIAERVMNEAAMSGRKLAKELLEEFMVLFGGLAGSFQPPDSSPAGVAKWAETKAQAQFDKYAGMTVDAATALAKY